MKNKLIIFLIGLFLLPISVNAQNKIYNIDMQINVFQDGSANITETWDVDGDDGTEWYKVLNNLGNSEVSNFTVSMDGEPLNYKTWDVDESLSQKRGYYGINYTSNGLELCFGKGDYNRHKFTLDYTISNFVFNTEDSQVIYFNLIDRLSNVDFDNFSVTLSSYYNFPDTLDVWGYGYKGYAYVNNGIIGMSNEENSDMNENYVVLLAKFPLNTFTNNVRYSQFNTFDDVYNMAENNSYKYNYDEDIDNKDDYDGSWKEKLPHVLFWTSLSLLLGLPFFLAISSWNSSYGYKNNKTIKKEDVNIFRDIPCNKDIYYANALIKLNDIDYNKSNILGAIILKWVKENKIKFYIIKKEKKGIFNFFDKNGNKNIKVIDFTLNCTFDNEIENKLYNVFKSASKDGILEAKELEQWCYDHSNEYINILGSLSDDIIEKLHEQGHIRKRKNKEECKNKNVMDDMIYEDSVKLSGLKKYLTDFSNMNTKEVMDVHLWDEYLMFAYLFGIADTVAKQLKDMYPEVVEEMKNINFDYSTIRFVSCLSTGKDYYIKRESGSGSSGISYSSGGGGRSSGGGGGGSFGGGGGGSR